MAGIFSISIMVCSDAGGEISKIPIDMKLVLFHCWFTYNDKRGLYHTAECTRKVPRISKEQDEYIIIKKKDFLGSKKE